MFMMCLLLDELDYNDAVKFRCLWRSQLGPDFIGVFPDYTEKIHEHHGILTEHKMYPAIFTRSVKMKKSEIEKSYHNPPHLFDKIRLFGAILHCSAGL